jgi:hypothetical protein
VSCMIIKHSVNDIPQQRAASQCMHSASVLTRMDSMQISTDEMHAMGHRDGIGSPATEHEMLFHGMSPPSFPPFSLLLTNQNRPQHSHSADSDLDRSM